MAAALFADTFPEHPGHLFDVGQPSVAPSLIVPPAVLAEDVAHLAAAARGVADRPGITYIVGRPEEARSLRDMEEDETT